MPPIAPIKDKQGRLMASPTLIPFCEVSIEQVFQMITCNENLKALTEQVRNSKDLRAAKASLLPYVTPCGTFTRRSSKDFVSPSHLVIVDVDDLHSYQEAVEMRRMLYDDPLLQPVLTFISPSGLGVKAFVPCLLEPNSNYFYHLPVSFKSISMTSIVSRKFAFCARRIRAVLTAAAFFARSAAGSFAARKMASFLSLCMRYPSSRRLFAVSRSRYHNSIISRKRKSFL